MTGVDRLQLRQRVRESLCWSADGLGEREISGYNGREMYGKESDLAFSCDVSPQSREGHALQALGLECDSLGRGWVYYLK